MQQPRAVRVTDGCYRSLWSRVELAEDEAKSKKQIPFGNDNKKALHAADARFARHHHLRRFRWSRVGVAEDDGKTKAKTEADSLRE